MSTPLPPPLPTKPSERERGDFQLSVDFQLLLELWHAGPVARDVALEMADRNRIRSERK